MWRRGRASHPCLIFVISVALGGCQQDDPHVTRPSKASTLDPAETSTSTTPRPDVETLPHEIPSSTEPAAPIHPEPLVRIAPEVTKIVAPLDEEGYPDYLGAYEAAHSNIEPSKNIIAGLRELLGQQGLPEEAVEDYGRKLGVTLTKSGDAFFQTINLRPTFIAVKGDRELTAEERERLNGTLIQQQLDQAQTRPWSREEFPELYSWITTNEGILPRVHAACRRPDIYMPILAGNSLIDIELDNAAISQFTSYLSAYAMLKAQEGETDRAVDALVSLGHLGRRLLEIPVGQTFLLGLRARAMMDQLLLLVLRPVALTTEQLARLEIELDLLHPPGFDPRRFIEWDRMCFLDGMCQQFKELHNEPKAAKFDLNREMVIANSYFDRLVANPSEEVLVEIREEFTTSAFEIRQEIIAAVPDPSIFDKKDGSPGPSLMEFSEYIPRPERLMFLRALAHFVTYPQLMLNATDRDLCRHRLMTLGVQALLYQAKNNKIPDSLERMGSEELRTDPYSGQPFLMKIDDDSIVIYSVAENRTDDGGEGDLWLKEDMGVRVPRISR